MKNIKILVFTCMLILTSVMFDTGIPATTVNNVCSPTQATCSVEIEKLEKILAKALNAQSPSVAFQGFGFVAKMLAKFVCVMLIRDRYHGNKRLILNKDSLGSIILCVLTVMFIYADSIDMRNVTDDCSCALNKLGKKISKLDSSSKKYLAEIFKKNYDAKLAEKISSAGIEANKGSKIVSVFSGFSGFILNLLFLLYTTCDVSGDVETISGTLGFLLTKLTAINISNGDHKLSYNFIQNIIDDIKAICSGNKYNSLDNVTHNNDDNNKRLIYHSETLPQVSYRLLQPFSTAERTLIAVKLTLVAANIIHLIYRYLYQNSLAEKRTLLLQQIREKLVS